MRKCKIVGGMIAGPLAPALVVVAAIAAIAVAAVAGAAGASGASGASGVVDAAGVDRPRRADRQAPAGVALPVERSHHVFFTRATVNGIGPFWFTVDTGATLTVIDPATAERLALVVRDAEARVPVGLGPGQAELSATRGVIFRFGGLDPVRPETTYVVPVKAAEPHLGHRIDGVLGTDVLRPHVVEFDYPGSRVLIHPAGTDPGPGAVPIDLRGNRPLVPVTLTLPGDRTLRARLLLDTGNSGGWSLNAPFVRAHGLEDVFPNTPSAGLNLRVSVGVNGVTTSRVVTMPAVTMAGRVLPAADVALSMARDGLDASAEFDGIVGADVLRHFRLVIDYPGRRIALR